MTENWLDELERLRAAATPGEWTAEQHTRLRKGCMCLSCWEPSVGWDISQIDGPDCPDHGCWHNIRIGEADAALIVAAVNALPRMTAAVRAALELCDAADRRVLDAVPPSAANRLITEGSHTIRVGSLRSALAAALTDTEAGRDA